MKPIMDLESRKITDVDTGLTISPSYINKTNLEENKKNSDTKIKRKILPLKTEGGYKQLISDYVETLIRPKDTRYQSDTEFLSIIREA